MRIRKKLCCGWTPSDRITTARRPTATSPSPSAGDRSTRSATTTRRWAKRWRGWSSNSAGWTSDSKVLQLVHVCTDGMDGVCLLLFVSVVTYVWIIENSDNRSYLVTHAFVCKRDAVFGRSRRLDNRSPDSWGCGHPWVRLRVSWVKGCPYFRGCLIYARYFWKAVCWVVYSWCNVL